MPKETIHWGTTYRGKLQESEILGTYIEQERFEGYIYKAPGDSVPTNPLADDEFIMRSPTLEVFWSRPEEHGPVAYNEDATGHVQIGVDVDMNELKWTAQRAEKDGVSSTSFITEGLTRTQLNKLIKTLKRARDAAFGADE